MAKKTTGTVKKKATAGKPVKKAGGAQKPKTDAQREAIAKELRGLIPQLDSEGLAFLVEQARVHLYNMQVDKLNMAAEAANAASVKAASAAKAAGIKRTGGTQKTGGGGLRLEGSESGSSYYIYYRNGNIMFSRDEMVRLVKIANGAGTDFEIRERLFNWFDRERKDVFAFLPIENRYDDTLKVIATLLKKTFQVRGR